MTRVVIVGEIYNADLSIGGGPVYPPPGSPGSPTHPWVPPPPYPSHPWVPPSGGSPVYPDQGLPPGSPGSPTHPWVPPQGQPPGIWGGPGGLPPYVGGGPIPPPITPPPGGTEVPDDVYTPAPIPEEIASQIVVSVYDPKTMNWTTKSYPPR